jgi:hypothetical protein
MSKRTAASVLVDGAFDLTLYLLGMEVMSTHFIGTRVG